MRSESTTDRVLMLRPAAFGFNVATSTSNLLQQEDATRQPSEIARAALAEFDALKLSLEQAGVHVVCHEDTPQPQKPDAVFPNNWISMHRSGDLVLYPMLAENRRAELRRDIVALLASEYGWPRIHDFSDPATLGGVLEGTGSLVLDRVARVAYACLSPRTQQAAVNEFCRRLEYEPQIFRAEDASGRPIYHTNVLLTLGLDFALLCLDAAGADSVGLARKLEAGGRELLPISMQAMLGFAANMLEVKNAAGDRLLVCSTRALASLPRAARRRLEGRLRFVTAPLTTIERYGGGSARCMLAEIFAPVTL